MSLRTALRSVTGRFRAAFGDGAPPPPDADFWFENATSASGAGIRVTPDIAIKASAVYACVKVLAETMATTSLRMRKSVPGGSIDAPEHPLEEVIRYQPNALNTATEFWETMIFQAALRGESYAEIVPRGGGRVELIPLDPGRVTVEVLRDRSFRFRYTDQLTNSTRVLLQEEVFRVPGMSHDGLTPIRAVDVAAEAIGIGMAADQYAARVFSNRLNIGGYLTTAKSLSPEAQKNLVDALMKRFAGPTNAHRPIILGEGLKFERATMDASQAQLLEARKWQVTEVARFWRIPLHMLGIYEGSTHSNVEEQSVGFVRYTIRPWAKRIEQAIRRDLIVAKAFYFAEFNLESLLRGQTEQRGNYFAQALGSGGHAPWMTVNEVRRIEGWNPVEGGEGLRAPINSVVKSRRPS